MRQPTHDVPSIETSFVIVTDIQKRKMTSVTSRKLSLKISGPSSAGIANYFNGMNVSARRFDVAARNDRNP
jgi:hypothetical protein